MNYEKNYTEYANYVKTLGRSKGQGVYYEEHHIIPKCMGGLRYCNSRLYEKTKKETKFRMSEDHKAKLRSILTGRTLSAETRAKIGAAQRGRKHSEEWKLKHSEQLKGHKISDEQKLKISKSNKGKRLGIKQPPRDEAWRREASARAKAQWASRKEKGYNSLGDKEEIENE